MPRLTRRDINVLSLAFALGDIIFALKLPQAISLGMTEYQLHGNITRRQANITEKRTCLHKCVFLGAPEETRTPDLLIRSQTLYPAELPAHMRPSISRK